MDNRPVLIGAGQLVQREVDLAQAPTPVDTLAAAIERAAEDAGIGATALAGLDTVGIVDVMGWWPNNGPRLVAERIGAKPRREWQSSIGGDIPLVVANQMAREIASGGVRFGVVAGTNNVRSQRRARDARIKLEWPKGGGGEPELIGKNLGGNTPGESEYGIGQPTDVYPLFENALRARRGSGLAEHQQSVGRLMSRFTRVAAQNPYAWFPIERSADEIATVTESNRMIAFPYTKYMNAVMETDQAAAVLMCSADAARELGVPEDRWVHWWSGANAVEEHWYPSERPDFSRCDAMGRVALRTLEDAGVGADDVSWFDFYSCFPVAVELACEGLGLSEDDPRGFTVTGGLPYAGGPGNNYALHSLATLVERVRERAGTYGLATGNGWYLTKHSATLLGSVPREAAPAPVAPAPAPPAPPEETASTRPATGPAVIETYTVAYSRDEGPRRGIVVGRTAAGERFVANTPDDRRLLENFVEVENVGRGGNLRSIDGLNVFDPA